jgi:glycyl-tRNA synthetase
MSDATSPTPDAVTMEKIVSLCKRRGFVFPASEIYGGISNTYDYGHYGVLLKNNVKAQWWRAMLQERDDVVALDSAIIQHPRTWEASGHLAGFTDPLIDCRSCKKRFRADKLEDGQCGQKPSKRPGETEGCDLTEAREFNLMFKTQVGPVADEGSVVYLRPETAQGIFLNFKQYLQFSRKKPPFGIAQVGKSFRNEITPANFIFRTREFEQMEMEFFVPPETAQTWYDYWKRERFDWYLRLGVRPDHLRLREHDPDELSHYSSGTADVEYRFPMGWGELEGIANRGDFDLSQHAAASRQNLEYVDTVTGERYLPHVIEPAAGADRAALTFLIDAYDEDEVDGESRTVLRLHPAIAPVKVAVLPLVKKDGQPELARRIVADLRELMQVEYDEGGAIGRRYRRQDEIGTPWAVTVDHRSLEDDTVTVRDRDSLTQQRLPVTELPAYFQAQLREPWRSPKAGPAAGPGERRDPGVGDQ